MDTKAWGPGGWVFLHTITFNYPLKIDNDDPDHQERRHYTEQLFENLKYTLPCKYCRQSYKEFLEELPLRDYLNSRRDLAYWLYEIHNKVNNKLRQQEIKAVTSFFNDLEQHVKTKKISKSQAYRKLKRFVEKTMITEDDPSFEEVCAHYETFRAGCAKEKNGLAVCRSPPPK